MERKRFDLEDRILRFVFTLFALLPMALLPPDGSSMNKAGALFKNFSLLNTG